MHIITVLLATPCKLDSWRFLSLLIVLPFWSYGYTLGKIDRIWRLEIIQLRRVVVVNHNFSEQNWLRCKLNPGTPNAKWHSIFLIIILSCIICDYSIFIFWECIFHSDNNQIGSEKIGLSKDSAQTRSWKRPTWPNSYPTAPQKSILIYQLIHLSVYCQTKAQSSESVRLIEKRSSSTASLTCQSQQLHILQIIMRSLHLESKSVKMCYLQPVIVLILINK